jgi:hypothetical protein
MNTNHCHCLEHKHGVEAIILTVDNRVIARGILRLQVGPGRGAFFPVCQHAVAASIDTASYPEVLARVESHGPMHHHKLRDWWFHVGLSHPTTGLPDDPDHFHFEFDHDT